jgi:tRNA-5-methyluridine54 2-sulfurtransferase
MKCVKCGQKAVIKMPQHNMGLCRDDFLEWVPEQTARFIKKYAMFTPREKVLVAVSGGKDSLSLWDILQRLGYQADGLYLCLGIDGGVNYSDESQRLTEQFASQRGLKLHVLSIKDQIGKSIPELAEMSQRGREKPCSVCGLVKRHEMNRMAGELGYDVLATGHNLDDEAAVLFGNTLTWAGDYLLRQGPVLPGKPGLARKVKPLCRFYEREMTAYALLRGIDYIYEECPYAIGASSIYFKELLNQIENTRPGAKLTFYLNFLEARQKGMFTTPAESTTELHPCPACGQPTSSSGKCSYCRMLEQAQA